MNLDELTSSQKKALTIGTLIGALLGAGITWLMILTPSDQPPEEEPQPISAGDILNLTGAAVSLVKMVDNFRRQL